MGLAKSSEERIGIIHKNTYGSEMEIINYRNSRDLDILITTIDLDGTIHRYISKHKSYQSFNDGYVKSPYDTSISDIACVGVGIYSTRENGRISKLYNIYSAMIQRAIDLDAIICKEWLNFQSFASWYENASYHIDTDTLAMHRLNPLRNEYCPDNYILIPSKLAKSILCYNSNKTRNSKLMTNLYANIILRNKKTIYYKSFKSKEEADSNFSQAKYDIILNDIMSYKHIIPEDVYNTFIINIRV